MGYRGKILVMGDVHADFGRLNTFVNHKRPDLILQCGDFGYWPRYTTKRERKGKTRLLPKMHETRLYWCDGNHEDFEALRERKNDEVYPNVFYMPRGSTLELPDGRRVLFIGGGESHDKAWRVEQERAGGDKIWFAEERITPDDLARLPDQPIDIVVTHVAPREFTVWGGGHDMLQPDPSRLALSAALHKYKDRLSLWFFGHYHARIVGDYHGVRYFGLNMAGRSDWWIELPAAAQSA